MFVVENLRGTEPPASEPKQGLGPGGAAVLALVAFGGLAWMAASLKTPPSPLRGMYIRKPPRAREA